jgi:Mn2+/Fe2+ NRAMP family transporter
MMPALIIPTIGLNPSRSLVMSQVVLSFGIPFALVPLLIFCRNRDVMGTLVNHRLTTTVATVVVFLIVSLDVFLLYQSFFSARSGADGTSCVRFESYARRRLLQTVAYSILPPR